MNSRRMNRYCRITQAAGERRGAPRSGRLALAVPLHMLPAPLEHGALGVWDEVAVGALLVGCAVAYTLWFYLTGRKEKPQDEE